MLMTNFKLFSVAELAKMGRRTLWKGSQSSLKSVAELKIQGRRDHFRHLLSIQDEYWFN